MKVTLVTFGKKGDPKSFDLSKPTTVLGRKTDADLRIPLSDISRSHCEFVLRNGSVKVRDLDSSNGTFVNGEQITESELGAGDVVRLGPISFTVQIDGQPADVKPPSEKPAPAKKSESSGAPTIAPATGDESDDFDIEDIDELDIDELSDIDLDEDFDLSDVEEVDDLEEISEDDVVEEDK
jgi:pSer/pThr/pTyr-binding forkhead associated (FHA) protein